MKQAKRLLSLLLCLILLISALSACGRKNSKEEPAGSAAPVETAEAQEETAAPERQNGERFEDVIMIEGMEETIKLEHVINETAGFAIDYDYEGFLRRSASDRECFVWSYDDPENPENFVEVSYSAQDASAVVADVIETLSKDYEISKDPVTLDGAGLCTRIDASAVPGGEYTADVLQEVYVIPATDGCRVAKIQYLPEGSDGFGKRLAYLVNTITVMEAQGERAMSDEQALAAIERYCYHGNPDLKGIVDSGEYPVSWQVTEYSEEQIVVLFHSYTGADVRYYIDPVSGEAYVTEFVSGVTAEEQRTDETLNVWDYVNWW